MYYTLSINIKNRDAVKPDLKSADKHLPGLFKWHPFSFFYVDSGDSEV